ncbi:MAG TPA: SRPBCC family protein [Longimicrobiales bacterium]|nr:SRPBCC family protein [Longimicrobiales bacterium]
MAALTAEAAAEIGARAATVYDIIADYHVGHPSILPPRYFTGLQVERGGRGAGTIIRFGMKLLGRVTMARAEVAEPEPGRVLTETILDRRGMVTTFRVDPIGERRARVGIATSWTARGIAGLVERLLVPRLLTRVYAAELAQLDEVAREREAGP